MIDFDPPTTKPKQRAFLLNLAARIDWDTPDPAWLAAELRRLETHMHNRVSKPSRTVSQPVTWDVAWRIRALKAADPDMPQHVIAVKTGVQQARVNEVLIGKRL